MQGIATGARMQNANTPPSMDGIGTWGVRNEPSTTVRKSMAPPSPRHTAADQRTPQGLHQSKGVAWRQVAAGCAGEAERRTLNLPPLRVTLNQVMCPVKRGGGRFYTELFGRYKCGRADVRTDV